jgi:hypothetical protein
MHVLHIHTVCRDQLASRECRACDRVKDQSPSPLSAHRLMLMRLLYVVLIAGLILGFILLLRDPGVEALLRTIIR